jgi:hypothetical protein
MFFTICFKFLTFFYSTAQFHRKHTKKPPENTHKKNPLQSTAHEHLKIRDIEAFTLDREQEPINIRHLTNVGKIRHVVATDGIWWEEFKHCDGIDGKFLAVCPSVVDPREAAVVEHVETGFVVKIFVNIFEQDASRWWSGFDVTCWLYIDEMALRVLVGCGDGSFVIGNKIDKRKIEKKNLKLIKNCKKLLKN